VIRLLSLVAGLVLLVAGCDRAAPMTSAVPTPGPSPDAEGAAGAAEAIDALLDPPSRDLLATIDPAEAIVATITTTQAEVTAAAARARGLTAEVVANDIVVVDGPLQPVLAFAAAAHPVLVQLGEDPAVDRWLPDARPNVAIPVPGRPYLTRAFVVDLSRVTMPPERRAPMLRSLADAIETIDGRPYARLDLSGSCDPEEQGPVCTLYSGGSVTGAGERADDRSMRADARSAWQAILVDGTVFLHSVPRALVRSAEWTARHDPAAAKALSAYQTCCDAAWDPARPGTIQLSYVRPCAESVAPVGLEIAATGDCFERLVITVDLGAETVLSIDPRPGP
jgi:hypothetical protein